MRRTLINITLFTPIKAKEYLINPISEIDCEIMVELSELFKKYGANDVVEILKQYKCLKDEEIRDQLLQANMDFTQKESEEKEVVVERKKDLFKQLLELFSMFRNFLIVDGERIDTKFIFGYKKTNNEDFSEYYIILNPLNIENMKSLPFYINHRFTFYDEKKRDEMVIIIDNLLKDKDVKFVNYEEK